MDSDSHRCFAQTLGSRIALAMSATLFAMPALSVTVGIDKTVLVTSSITSLDPLTMDGGILRFSADSGAGGLTLSATNAVLGRGMIYNAYTQGSPTTTLSLFGTTQLSGAPAGAPPADGMYLHGDYYDSSGLDVINKGTLTQTGTGEFTLLGRTRLVNEGIFSIANDRFVKEYTGGSLNDVSFLNKGTLEKSAGSSGGTSVFLVRFDQQGGQVNLVSGSLVFSRGGTQTNAVFDADSKRTGHPGSIEFLGGHTFDDVTTKAGKFGSAQKITVAPGGWQQEATFTALGDIQIGNGATLVNSGTLRGGLLDGSGTLLPSGVINVSKGGALANSGTLTGFLVIEVGSGALLNNSGTLMGLVDVGSGALLSNSGTLHLQSKEAITIGSAGTLVNTGSLRMESLSSIAIGAGGTLSNNGNMQTNDGSISGAGLLDNQTGGTFQGNIERTFLPGGAQLIAVQNAGQFTVGTGNTVSVSQFDNVDGRLTVDGQLDVFGGVLNMRAGTLNGSGLINGDVFVGGVGRLASFKAGHSPGQMVINGDFSLLPGGVLELEVAVVDDMFQADRIIIGGGGNILLAGHVSFLIGAGIVLSDLDGSFGDPLFFGCDAVCSITYGSTFSYDFVGRPGSEIELLASGPRFIALGELGGIAPVPEPPMVMTMLAGISAIGAVAFRRRRVRASAAA